jgi:4-hydroxythreonine-4-phosphate dehydrogenase
MKPTIAITVGDCNGIGPEIALKSLLDPSVSRLCRPVLVGPFDVFLWYARKLKLPVSIPPAKASTRATRSSPRWVDIEVIETAHDPAYTLKPGTVSPASGRIAAGAIELAVLLVQTGNAAAMVTAPISKAAFHQAGFQYPGHTEYLQHLTHSRTVAMMLVSKALRVGLVTVHAPLREIPRLLTRSVLRDQITTIAAALRTDWGIRKPKLAVLGLNPHGGESGEIGTEEIDAVIPTLTMLRNEGLAVDGPFAADGFFARYRPGSYDAVVAMYHDQGLIPLKMLAAGQGVNYTAGLPIVRTSPDHGTAFDIAGRGLADPQSMIAAILLAAQIARRRNLTRKGGAR